MDELDNFKDFEAPHKDGQKPFNLEKDESMKLTFNEHQMIVESD